jgi:hypothetical protein
LMAMAEVVVIKPESNRLFEPDVDPTRKVYPVARAAAVQLKVTAGPFNSEPAVGEISVAATFAAVKV